MPGMDGFEFARGGARDSRWRATPLVALSRHASTQAIWIAGREAGFTDYVAKFDR